MRFLHSIFVDQAHEPLGDDILFSGLTNHLERTKPQECSLTLQTDVRMADILIQPRSKLFFSPVFSGRRSCMLGLHNFEKVFAG